MIKLILSTGETITLNTSRDLMRNESVPSKRTSKNGFARQARRSYNNNLSRQSHHSANLIRSIYTDPETFELQTTRTPSSNHNEIRTSSPDQNYRTYDSHRAH
jgi:hypothetical protein